MILHEITGSEDNETYQALEIENLNRQYEFLRSVVTASISIGRPFLSQHVIKALNFHAITCLHIAPGVYRPCEVMVGKYRPPEHFRVPALMDDFVNDVNFNWEKTDAVWLAARALWRLNSIHPFVNGNGRTARAVCYFIVCVKSGGWLSGDNILPELLRENRAEYVEALKNADKSLEKNASPNGETGNLDLSNLHALLTRLLDEQMSGRALNG